MNYQKHCPGCFVNKAGFAVCPNCGYDESAPRSPLYLPHGIVIGGQYRIGRVLGQPGGFGVTYLAWDVHLQRRVAIKEYLPKALCGRQSPMLEVTAHKPEDEQPFRDGLDRFLHEARVMARFDHPNIVRVRSFFRANGTAYLVMEYYDGTSLGAYLGALPDGRIPSLQAVEMLGPVLQGLQFVHDNGVVHRDIKPQNIYLATGGRAILLDFGAARQRANDDVTSGMSVVLSEGYAPLEQYQHDVPQGPATDIYGLAATLYRVVVGRAPPPALDRLGHDALELPMGTGLTEFERVLRKGLALRYDDRYITATDFLHDLHQALGLDADADHGDDGVRESGRGLSRLPPVPDAPPGAAESTVTISRSLSTHAPRKPAPEDSRRGSWLVALAVLLGAAMIAITLWMRLP